MSVAGTILMSKASKQATRESTEWYRHQQRQEQTKQEERAWVARFFFFFEKKKSRLVGWLVGRSSCAGLVQPTKLFEKIRRMVGGTSAFFVSRQG